MLLALPLRIVYTYSKARKWFKQLH